MLSITGTTGLTGLLGSPVKHSLSPLMHNESFQLLNLDFVYLCFECREEDLPAMTAGLRLAKIRGFNLTMPLKNKMVELADRLSPAASLIGAVNTVVHEDGLLIGHNTDGLGFMRSAEEAGFHLPGRTMTLLGAGGAATAIAAQAALDGMKEIRIFLRPSSRFYPRIQELSKRLNQTTGCKVSLHSMEDPVDLRDSLASSYALVNATSLGMSPDTDGCPLPDSSFLHPQLAVMDIVYQPRQTRLLQMAAELGCPTMNGLYMLLYQGAEAFRLFTGQDMPTNSIKEKFFK